MNDTIRLIYPQWQGGDIAGWFPRFDPSTISRGYYLGSMLLNFLAPETSNPTFTVPVECAARERTVADGVIDRDILLEQSKAALDILELADPARILTLGGDCSVSIVPFTYLARKYNNDVAVVWIDAHPDITLPGDKYDGLHAMALAAVAGMGDERIMELLPAKVPTDRLFITGLRDWEHDEIKQRQKMLGIKYISAEDFASQKDAVSRWVAETGAKNVMVHFDLDSLDPRDLFAAVAPVPNGLLLEDVIGIINSLAAEFNLVGLTIAEPMPTVALRLRDMLNRLPLVR